LFLIENIIAHTRFRVNTFAKKSRKKAKYILQSTAEISLKTWRMALIFLANKNRQWARKTAFFALPGEKKSHKWRIYFCKYRNRKHIY
jgi:hypothetical protein